MASELDICNLALARLGDSATVTSINPPEGSMQADQCARFYPIARDFLLEYHPWSFAIKRVALAELPCNTESWQHCYAVPNDAVNLMAVIAPDAQDDYSVSARTEWREDPVGYYTPQQFVNEVNEKGQQVIYTNQADAVLRYSARINDTTKFSPMFVDALSWLLASHLSGPILKGEAGASMSNVCLKNFRLSVSQAMDSDSNQRKVNPIHNVAWMVGR